MSGRSGRWSVPRRPDGSRSMISSSGERVTVVDGLPSGMTSLPSGDTIGAAAVAFLGSKLFVLSAGGGCTHANPDNPPGIVRANLKKGTWNYITATFTPSSRITARSSE